MRQSFVVTGPSQGGSGAYKTAYVSSNFLAQTGYERDEVADCDFSLFQADSGDIEGLEVETNFRKEMGRGVSYHSRVTQQRKDGTERLVFVSAIPLKDRDTGGVTNYVVVFSDMPDEMVDAEDEEGDSAMADTQMQKLAERIVLVDPEGNKVVNVSEDFGLAVLGGVTKKVKNLMGEPFGHDLRTFEAENAQNSPLISVIFT